MIQVKFRSVILRYLDRAAIERLELRPIDLVHGQCLASPNSRIDELLFVEEGLASMTTAFQDGSQVESGMFGSESVIGAPALFGVPHNNNNIAVQVPGHGYMARLEPAELEFRRREQFHDLVLRYVQSQVIQAAQSAGCNARHNVQQRLSRWLLLCRDRINAEVMPLTQEFLAIMLGVERPAVSVVAAKLQERGLIEYSRGRVRIANRQKLEEVACECYRVLRRERDEYMDFAEALSAA